MLAMSARANDALAATSSSECPRTLFVGGLPISPAATDADLAHHFGQFGVVESSPVVLHRGNERSRGFGFVTFTTAHAALSALEMSAHEIGGHALVLRPAESHNPEWKRPVRVRRRRRQLSPGVIWLENFFDEDEQRALADVALAAGHRDSCQVEPSETGFLSKDRDGCDFYTPSYVDGVGGVPRELKLSMCCLGRHWDVQRGAYAPTRTDCDEQPVAAIPPALLEAAQRVLDAVRDVLVDDAGGDADAAAWACADFDIGIVNLYDRAGRLGLHQDCDESDEAIAAGKPVVSLSFGDTALFEYIEGAALAAHLRERARRRSERPVDGADDAHDAHDAHDGGGGGDGERERCGKEGREQGGDRDGHDEEHIRAAELERLTRRTVKLGSGDALVFGGASRLVYHGVSKIIPHSCRVRPWNSYGIKRGRLNCTLRQY